MGDLCKTNRSGTMTKEYKLLPKEPTPTQVRAGPQGVI